MSNWWEGEHDELLARYRDLEARCEGYEKALSFYADYCAVMYAPDAGAPPLEDAWHTAREALKAHEKLR